MGTVRTMLVTEITLFFILTLSLQTGAIPVVNPKPGCPSTDFTVLGPDLCYLTPKLGSTGTRKFLEECEGLDRFTTVPMPLTDVSSAFGVHPVVCCPKPL